MHRIFLTFLIFLSSSTSVCENACTKCRTNADIANIVMKDCAMCKRCGVREQFNPQIQPDPNQQAIELVNVDGTEILNRHESLRLPIQEDEEDLPLMEADEPIEKQIIDCRTACRNCRQKIYPLDIHEIYCDMCRECRFQKQTRRFITSRRRKQELVIIGGESDEKDYAEHRKGLRKRIPEINRDNSHSGESQIDESIESHENLHKIYRYQPEVIPKGCPTPPICDDYYEDETPRPEKRKTTARTTTTPRPTCPPIQQCRPRRTTMKTQPPQTVYVPMVMPDMQCMQSCMMSCAYPHMSTHQTQQSKPPPKVQPQSTPAPNILLQTVQPQTQPVTYPASPPSAASYQPTVPPNQPQTAEPFISPQTNAPAIPPQTNPPSQSMLPTSVPATPADPPSTEPTVLPPVNSERRHILDEFQYRRLGEPPYIFPACPPPHIATHGGQHTIPSMYQQNLFVKETTTDFIYLFVGVAKEKKVK